MSLASLVRFLALIPTIFLLSYPGAYVIVASTPTPTSSRTSSQLVTTAHHGLPNSKPQERAEALRKSQMSREADDGASLADLEWAIELLTTRCRVRWDRLYGLHVVRQKYFDNQRQLHPAADYLELTQMLPCDAEVKSPKAARQSLWPIPIKLPRNPELIHEDKMICLRNSGVDWSEYALPDQPTGTSEPARRRIERGVPAMEETVAEPDADVRAIESTTTPLLNQLDRDARSSGFFSTFGSFLRRRHL
ncbi:hypothetical protein NBRC10512_002063 [Rhodotorula toruloides]